MSGDCGCDAVAAEGLETDIGALLHRGCVHDGRLAAAAAFGRRRPQIAVRTGSAIRRQFIRGWLNDLTSKDPYYILPVAMGITMVLTQVLTPSPMSNPRQKTMGYVMSGFFSLLMLTLPSGLTLYIFTNNVLSIAQQMYLRRAIRMPRGKCRCR